MSETDSSQSHVVRRRVQRSQRMRRRTSRLAERFKELDDNVFSSSGEGFKFGTSHATAQRMEDSSTLKFDTQ